MPHWQHSGKGCSVCVTSVDVGMGEDRHEHPAHDGSWSDVNQTQSGSFIANFMQSLCPGQYILPLSKAYYLTHSSYYTTLAPEPLAPRAPVQEFRSAFRHSHCLQARKGKLGDVIVYFSDL